MPGRDANLGFVGTPGQGKTAAALYLLRARARVIVVDPAGSAKQDFVVYDPARVVSIVRNYYAFQVVWRCKRLDRAARGEGIDRILFALEDERRAEAAARGIEPAEVVWRTTVFLDEFATLSTTRRLSEKAEETMRTGRHDGISVCVSTQRARDMDPNVRALLDRLYIYRQPEERDLDAIKQLDRELPNVVRSLPDHHYVRYDFARMSWSVHAPMPIGGTK